MPEQPDDHEQPIQPPEVDPALLEIGLQRLRSEQTLGPAVGAGIAAAAAVAIVWATCN